MNTKLLSVVGSAAVLCSCASEKQKCRSHRRARRALDRTSLPIKEPQRPTYKELDARNVKPPARFAVTAPKGAPNVVVILIDDMGFGASSRFGGRSRCKRPRSWRPQA